MWFSYRSSETSNMFTKIVEENGETHPRLHVGLERKVRFKWTEDYKVPQGPGHHHISFQRSALSLAPL